VLSEAGQNKLQTAALIYCLEVVGLPAGVGSSEDGQRHGPATRASGRNGRKRRRSRTGRRFRSQRKTWLACPSRRRRQPEPRSPRSRHPRWPARRHRDRHRHRSNRRSQSFRFAPEEEELDLDKYADLEIMTYYQMLGIESSALDAEVKGGYFRLAKMYHPDKFFGQSEEFIAAVRRIFEAQSRAYNVLKDPVQRRDYDRSLAQKGRGKGPVGEAAPVKESDEVTRARSTTNKRSRPWKSRISRPPWMR
jgi:hypothetical protein